MGILSALYNLAGDFPCRCAGDHPFHSASSDTYWLAFCSGFAWCGYLPSRRSLARPGLASSIVQSLRRRAPRIARGLAVLEQSSAGNYEELADHIYMEEDNFRARDYDKGHFVAHRFTDPFTGVESAKSNWVSYALPCRTSKRVVQKDPGYDFHRAKGLLAHAHANSGQPSKADLFRQAVAISTLSGNPITTTRSFSRHRTD